MGEALDTTETDITLSAAPSAGLIEVGSEITVDVETMVVTAIAGSTLTVVRGWLDTDPATHTTGTPVDVDPRFSPFDVYDAMQDELLSWGPRLFRVEDDTFVTAQGDQTLELPVAWAGAYGIVDVRGGPSSSVLAEGIISAWPRVNTRLQRGSTSWDGAPTSGLLLRFTEGYTNAGLMYVAVALPFTTSAFSYTADLVADVKLLPSMLDILTMGTKLRLRGDDDNSESDRSSQGQPRDDRETQPNVQSAQFGVALYNRRRAEEEARLQRLYPLRVT